MEEDLVTRYVFMSMIVLANADGVVDITLNSLARRFNIPLTDLTAAIKKLEQPDRLSRCDDDEGRRLLKLDGHREWGWRIVNHSKYNTLRSEKDRREYMKNYMQKRRHDDHVNSVNVNSKPPLALLANTDTDTNTDITITKAVKTPPAKLDVEHEEIKFWNSLKENAAYKHINLDVEKGKMTAWLSLPKNKSRRMTKQFVLNWLNKVERPMEGGNSGNNFTGFEKQDYRKGIF